jgi:hypothetical protein
LFAALEPAYNEKGENKFLIEIYGGVLTASMHLFLFIIKKSQTGILLTFSIE